MMNHSDHLYLLTFVPRLTYFLMPADGAISVCPHLRSGRVWPRHQRLGGSQI